MRSGNGAELGVDRHLALVDHNDFIGFLAPGTQNSQFIRKLIIIINNNITNVLRLEDLL